MSREAEPELQELREENELLMLQLHQIQEELEHYYLENQRLAQNESRVPDPAHDEKRESGASPVPVAGPFRGSWRLVRHVLDSGEAGPPVAPPLEAIVQADPLFQEQVARADRAEAQAAALQAQLDADSAIAVERVEALTRQLIALKQAGGEEVRRVGAMVANLEGSLGDKMSNVIGALESVLVGNVQGLSENLVALDGKVERLEGTLLSILERKMDAQLSALGGSFQVYFSELEESLAGLRASTATALEDAVEATRNVLSETTSSALAEDRLAAILESVREMPDALRREALAPVATAQREAEALRRDLSTALKMQAIRDGDLRELQERFAKLSEDKAEQEAVLIELREKLTAASAYLRTLRQGSGEAGQDSAVRDIAALLAGDD